MAAKKFIEKIVKYDIVPFNYDLIVVVSDSIQQSRTNRNDILGYYEPDDHHGAMHCYVGHQSYIFLNYGADIGTIAHETFHFIWRLMQWIGAEHNNEVMAYHLGYYVREIAKFIYSASANKKLPSNVKRLETGPAKVPVKSRIKRKTKKIKNTLTKGK